MKTRVISLLTTTLLLAAATAPVRVAAGDPGNNEWPMWGGTADRNMVSGMKNLPTEWDVKTKKNIKWVAELGSQSYGNPVVAGGTVFLGTNNEAPRDPAQGGDRGVAELVEGDADDHRDQEGHEQLRFVAEQEQR